MFRVKTRTCHQLGVFFASLPKYELMATVLSPKPRCCVCAQMSKKASTLDSFASTKSTSSLCFLTKLAFVYVNCYNIVIVISEC